MLCLVVDDERSIRSFVRAIAQSQQFDVLEAENGTGAMDIVRLLDGRVDLIITDVHMPGGDGATFARLVKAAYPAVAIILMSGYTQTSEPFDFIAKPFSWQEMLDVMRRVLEQRPSPDQSGITCAAHHHL